MPGIGRHVPGGTLEQIGIFDFLVDAFLRRRALLGLSLGHGGTSYDASRDTSSAGVVHSSNNDSTWARVPRSGSIIGMRRSGSLPTSRMRLSQLAATTASAHFARH